MTGDVVDEKRCRVAVLPCCRDTCEFFGRRQANPIQRYLVRKNRAFVECCGTHPGQKDLWQSSNLFVPQPQLEFHGQACLKRLQGGDPSADWGAFAKNTCRAALIIGESGWAQDFGPVSYPIDAFVG